VNLLSAFGVMLGGLHAADAPGRQVTGILRWRELVHEAVKRSPGGTSRAEGTSTGVVASETHLEWRIASGHILDALRKQQHAAELDYEQAVMTAAAAEQEAALADSEAASAQMAAAQEQAAAQACASGDQEGQAAAHAAAAAGLAAIAGAAAARAEDARRRARAAEKLAEASMAWGIAAKNARTFGKRLLAGENAIAFPVAEAIRAAGGPAEVYGAKHALTMERPLAMRGGPR
jgi:hypothetical protein